MRDLTAAEHHCHLHLVAFLQESPRVPRLRVEVVIVDARSVLHLFQVNDMLLLFRDARHLGLLELELAVVHDPDDGRPRERCDLHQVQPLCFCLRKRRVQLENSQLAAVGRNYAQWANANLAVHADALGAILNGRCLRQGHKKIADTTPESATRDEHPLGGRRSNTGTPAAHLARARGPEGESESLALLTLLSVLNLVNRGLKSRREKHGVSEACGHREGYSCLLYTSP